MTFKEFREKWAGKPVDSFVVFSSRLVHSLMLRPVCKLQIFYSIIGFIAVDVVHNFFGFKNSAKTLFHNRPVFGNPIKVCMNMVRGIQTNITFPLYKAAALPVVVLISPVGFISTFKRAKSFAPTLVAPKFFSAVRTFLNTFPRQVITSTRAMSRFIGWWAVKGDFTNFTYKFHGDILPHTKLGGK